MDLYLLDDQLRRTEVVDDYVSLVWAERLASYGDFELELPSTRANLSLFPHGRLLHLPEAMATMVVETRENKVDADGQAIFKVSGRSLESLFEYRASYKGFNATDLIGEKWQIVDTPANIVKTLYNAVALNKLVNANEGLPFTPPYLVKGVPRRQSLLDVYGMVFEPDTLYNHLQKVCTAFKIGFSLTRSGDQPILNFRVIFGTDRTSTQSVHPPVIFSPDLDNLTDITELDTVAGRVNVVYVMSPSNTATVYEQDLPVDVTGFNRRSRIVKVGKQNENITAAERVAELEQIGREELAKNQGFMAFDGEISQYNQYRYLRDYQLGDFVEVRNYEGFTNVMRVTEQLFTSDATGDRSYPALTIERTYEPGTWASQGPFVNWETAVGTWTEQ